MSFLGKLLGALWLFFVASHYFKYHTYYYELDPVVMRGIIVTLAVFAALAGLGWYLLKRKGKKSLMLSPLKIVLGVFATTLLTLGIFYINLDPGVFVAKKVIVSYGGGRMALIDEGISLDPGVSIDFSRGVTATNWSDDKIVFPPEIQELFVAPSVLRFLGNLSLNLGALLGFLVLFTLLFHNVGAFLLRKKETTVFEFFESVGIGMGVMMGLMFAMGILGQITPLAAWIIFGGMGVATIHKSKQLATLLKYKIEVPLEGKAWEVLVPAIALLILFALNTVSMIRPFPVGFDSLIRYHNLPNLLLEYKYLISEGSSYSYELLTTWALALLGSKTAGIFMVYLGGLLALGLVFYTLQKKWGGREALWWTTLLASLPMTSFLLHIDPKVDLPLLFFSLLAIHFAIQAVPHLKTREGRRPIIMTAVFLGIAFGIKYTTFMLLGAVAAFWAYEFWGGLAAVGMGSMVLAALGQMGFWTIQRALSAGMVQALVFGLGVMGVILLSIGMVRRGLSWAKMRVFVLAGVIFALVVSPWLVYNAVTNHSLSPQALLFANNPHLDADIKSLGEVSAACPTTVAPYNELAYYTGNFSGNAFWIPLNILWEVNINSGLPNNRITDIGFLLLGLLLWAVWGWKKAAGHHENLKKITAFTGLYGVFWVFSANAIIWYGMPLFVGILWIYAAAFKEERWIKAVLSVGFLLGITVLYAESAGQAEGIMYAGKVIDKSVYQEFAFTGSEEFAPVLNSEEGLKKNVLWNGNFMQYFIVQNDHRVLTDTFLETFDCKLSGATDEETLAKLRQYNIGYVLYSPLVLRVETDPGGPLHERFGRFEDFAREHLILEMHRPKLQLYRVP